MRHRLAVLSIALIALPAAAAPAAAQDTEIGVKVGVNFARLSLDEDQFAIDAVNRRTGLLAGAFVAREIRQGLGIQVDGVITQKGARIDVNDVFTGGFEIDANLTYLEIPVLARYSLPLGGRDSALHVFAGPALGVLIRDRQRIRFPDADDEWIDLDEDDLSYQPLTGTDVGLTLGAAFEVNLFHVDVRYTHGFGNINDFEDELSDPDDFPIRNRVFTISVGYRFR